MSGNDDVSEGGSRTEGNAIRRSVPRDHSPMGGADDQCNPAGWYVTVGSGSGEQPGQAVSLTFFVVLAQLQR
jgi:hypothetical protein